LLPTPLLRAAYMRVKTHTTTWLFVSTEVTLAQKATSSKILPTREKLIKT
jgi:hypothetical protein